MLTEIQIKNHSKEIEKNKQIKYILDHTKFTYSKNMLDAYSFQDIEEIYNNTKKKNKSILIKFYHFIFNIK